MPDRAETSSREDGVGDPREILHHCAVAFGEAIDRLADNLLSAATHRKKQKNTNTPLPFSRQSSVEHRKTDGQC